MGYALKQIEGDLYNPKTPYNEQEMNNGFLTSDPDRIAVYKYRGYAERVKRELGLNNMEVVQV